MRATSLHAYLVMKCTPKYVEAVLYSRFSREIFQFSREILFGIFYNGNVVNIFWYILTINFDGHNHQHLFI